MAQKNAKKYIVNTHDTLWDLSKKFYGNPTLWPLIFEYNNLPHISKKTGSRIIDPDLILIGQKLIIPDKKLADKLGEAGLKQVISNICENRANHQKNSLYNTQVHRLRQRQSNDEQIACSPAKKIQSPFFEFDLGKIPIREVKSGMFRIVMRASGTLLLQSTSSGSSAVTVQGLDSLKGSAKYFAENAAGKLFSETTLKFNDKTKTVSFSNKFTTQSNLANHPSVSLAFETNAQGKPVLVGSMTQDLVKGELDNHIFIGEKIGIEIEVTAEDGKELGNPVVGVNAPVGATAGKPVTPEDTVWVELALVGGATLLIAAGTAVTVILSKLPFIGGRKNKDSASVAYVEGMLVTAKKDLKHGTKSLWNRFLVGAGFYAAPAMAQPDSTGLLDEED